MEKFSVVQTKITGFAKKFEDIVEASMGYMASKTLVEQKVYIQDMNLCGVGLKTITGQGSLIKESSHSWVPIPCKQLCSQERPHINQGICSAEEPVKGASPDKSSPKPMQFEQELTKREEEQQEVPPAAPEIVVEEPAKLPEIEQQEQEEEAEETQEAEEQAPKVITCDGVVLTGDFEAAFCNSAAYLTNLKLKKDFVFSKRVNQIFMNTIKAANVLIESNVNNDAVYAAFAFGNDDLQLEYCVFNVRFAVQAYNTALLCQSCNLNATGSVFIFIGEALNISGLVLVSKSRIELNSCKVELRMYGENIGGIVCVIPGIMEKFSVVQTKITGFAKKFEDIVEASMGYMASKTLVEQKVYIQDMNLCGVGLTTITGQGSLIKESSHSWVPIPCKQLCSQERPHINQGICSAEEPAKGASPDKSSPKPMQFEQELTKREEEQQEVPPAAPEIVVEEPAKLPEIEQQEQEEEAEETQEAEEQAPKVITCDGVVLTGDFEAAFCNSAAYLTNLKLKKDFVFSKRVNQIFMNTIKAANVLIESNVNNDAVYAAFAFGNDDLQLEYCVFNVRFAVQAYNTALLCQSCNLNATGSVFIFIGEALNISGLVLVSKSRIELNSCKVELRMYGENIGGIVCVIPGIMEKFSVVQTKITGFAKKFEDIVEASMGYMASKTLVEQKVYIQDMNLCGVGLKTITGQGSLIKESSHSWVPIPCKQLCSKERPHINQGICSAEEPAKGASPDKSSPKPMQFEQELTKREEEQQEVPPAAPEIVVEEPAKLPEIEQQEQEEEAEETQEAEEQAPKVITCDGVVLTGDFEAAFCNSAAYLTNLKLKKDFVFSKRVNQIFMNTIKAANVLIESNVNNDAVYAAFAFGNDDLQLEYCVFNVRFAVQAYNTALLCQSCNLNATGSVFIFIGEALNISGLVLVSKSRIELNSCKVELRMYGENIGGIVCVIPGIMEKFSVVQTKITGFAKKFEDIVEASMGYMASKTLVEQKVYIQDMNLCGVGLKTITGQGSLIKESSHSWVPIPCKQLCSQERPHINQGICSAEEPVKGASPDKSSPKPMQFEQELTKREEEQQEVPPAAPEIVVEEPAKLPEIEQQEQEEEAEETQEAEEQAPKVITCDGVVLTGDFEAAFCNSAAYLTNLKLKKDFVFSKRVNQIFMNTIKAANVLIESNVNNDAVYAAFAFGNDDLQLEYCVFNVRFAVQAYNTALLCQSCNLNATGSVFIFIGEALNISGLVLVSKSRIELNSCKVELRMYGENIGGIVCVIPGIMEKFSVVQTKITGFAKKFEDIVEASMGYMASKTLVEQKVYIQDMNLCGVGLTTITGQGSLIKESSHSWVPIPCKQLCSQERPHINQGICSAEEPAKGASPDKSSPKPMQFEQELTKREEEQQEVPPAAPEIVVEEPAKLPEIEQQEQEEEAEETQEAEEQAPKVITCDGVVLTGDFEAAFCNSAAYLTNLKLKKDFVFSKRVNQIFMNTIKAANVLIESNVNNDAVYAAFAFGNDDLQLEYCVFNVRFAVQAYNTALLCQSCNLNATGSVFIFIGEALNISGLVLVSKSRIELNSCKVELRMYGENIGGIVCVIPGIMEKFSVVQTKITGFAKKFEDIVEASMGYMASKTLVEQKVYIQDMNLCGVGLKTITGQGSLIKESSHSWVPIPCKQLCSKERPHINQGICSAEEPAKGASPDKSSPKPMQFEQELTKREEEQQEVPPAAPEIVVEEPAKLPEIEQQEQEEEAEETQEAEEQAPKVITCDGVVLTGDFEAAFCNSAAYLTNLKLKKDFVFSKRVNQIFMNTIKAANVLIESNVNNDAVYAAFAFGNDDLQLEYCVFNVRFAVQAYNTALLCQSCNLNATGSVFIFIGEALNISGLVLVSKSRIELNSCKVELRMYGENIGGIVCVIPGIMEKFSVVQTKITGFAKKFENIAYASVGFITSSTLLEQKIIIDHSQLCGEGIYNLSSKGILIKQSIDGLLYDIEKCENLCSDDKPFLDKGICSQNQPENSNSITKYFQKKNND
ncbi:Hypothetical_protein [Hexamita inflata]|uniref:Hypothetical_protein n=1 Tax=Hexamita inflata TaxID=28002 RepID=A0AA86VNF3_9EUKA|nr:Hypothetical protein HINF_LOCUS58998 [Hexamita inflata]